MIKQEFFDLDLPAKEGFILPEKEISMPKFNVPKMSCGHCTAAIEKSVKNFDPTALLSFDLTNRVVDIDSADDDAELIAAIKDAGFEATAV